MVSTNSKQFMRALAEALGFGEQPIQRIILDMDARRRVPRLYVEGFVQADRNEAIAAVLATIGDVEVKDVSELPSDYWVRTPGGKSERVTPDPDDVDS